MGHRIILNSAARRLFNQIEIRSVNAPGGSGESDLACPAAGEVSIGYNCPDLLALQARGRLGKLWKRKSSVSGKATATGVRRQYDIFAAGLRHSLKFGRQIQLDQ